MMANFDGNSSPQSSEKKASGINRVTSIDHDHDDNYTSAKLQSNIQRLKKMDEVNSRSSTAYHDGGGTNSRFDNSNNNSSSNHNNQNRPRLEIDEDELRELCNRYDMYYTIESTQRTITRKDGNTLHEKGGEVFVGKLPRDVFESDLLPLASKYGELCEFRIMLDYSGYNRGYAFLTYKKRSEANAALKGLNNYEIRSGKLLGVCRSVDNCRLFVGGIPKAKKKPEIMEEMKKVSDGVVDVIVYPSAADKTKNRGFAFVEYESHKTAAMARRKLMPGKIQLWGQPIAVDWAEPEIDVDDDIMAQVKILYVRNLMLNTREETLEQIMTDITGIATIERVKKIRDYAFVHFNSRENAAIALKQTNGMVIDGSTVEVTWAKPVDREAYAKYNKNANRNQHEHGMHQNFDHLKGMPHTQMPPSVYYITQPNINQDTNTHAGLLPHNQGIPVFIGAGGRPLQAAHGQPVILAHQPTPAVSASSQHHHQHHHQHQAGRQYAVSGGSGGGQQSGRSSAGGSSMGYSRQSPSNAPYMPSNSVYGRMDRVKPRGAGGIRAVGSRQYLGNKEASGIQATVATYPQIPLTAYTTASTVEQVNPMQDNSNSTYVLGSERSESSDQLPSNSTTSQPTAQPPSATSQQTTTVPQQQQQQQQQPQTIFSPQIYPSYISTIPSAQIVTTSAQAAVAQTTLTQQLSHGHPMPTQLNQVPVMYALPVLPGQENLQGAQLDQVTAIQQGQNAQNFNQRVNHHQYMLIQGQAPPAPATAQVPVTTANLDSQVSTFADE